MKKRDTSVNEERRGSCKETSTTYEWQSGLVYPKCFNVTRGKRKEVRPLGCRMREERLHDFGE